MKQTYINAQFSHIDILYDDMYTYKYLTLCDGKLLKLNNYNQMLYLIGESWTQKYGMIMTLPIKVIVPLNYDHKYLIHET